MSFEGQMKEWEDLREQDKCLEISEELLPGGGVRFTHGLQKAKTGAYGTQKIQIEAQLLKPS